MPRKTDAFIIFWQNNLRHSWHINYYHRFKHRLKRTKINITNSYIYKQQVLVYISTSQIDSRSIFSGDVCHNEKRIMAGVPMYFNIFYPLFMYHEMKATSWPADFKLFNDFNEPAHSAVTAVLTYCATMKYYCTVGLCSKIITGNFLFKTFCLLRQEDSQHDIFLTNITFLVKGLFQKIMLHHIVLSYLT